MKVLVVTSNYPSEAMPTSGIFIKRQVEGLREVGVDVDVFAYRGRKSPFNYARVWWQVRRQLNQHKYDLIHAQFGNSGILALPKRLPFVITYQGTDVMGIFKDGRYTWMGKIGQLVSRLSAYFADEAMVVSAHMKAHLPSHRDYIVLPSGVDRTLFKPIPLAEARAQLGLRMDKRLVFFPAHPAKHIKRFELAQATVQLVQETMPDVELIPAGGIDTDAMPLYLNACDALILTSKHEGSPNVVKEAICCHLPVVSVDVGDVRERIRDIKGCFVSDEDTPEALAQGLMRVLEHPQRLHAEAFAEALSREHEIAQLISIYERVLARQK